MKVWIAIVAALCVALAGCSTANVSQASGPLFDTADIAPVNLTASSAADGSWQMDIVTRGPQLAEAVVIFTDGVTEHAELAGATTATLSSSHNGTLACVMVKLLKNDYWYFDNGKNDYWYFDGAGRMMPASEGARWYSEGSY
jgi:hypothetical protein